jgi:hypothetical protein
LGVIAARFYLNDVDDYAGICLILGYCRLGDEDVG